MKSEVVNPDLDQRGNAPPPAGPPQVPDHELLRRIGGGSYGEVWLARNVVGTFRAVKVVHRKTFENERPYEREYAGIQKFEPISRTHEGFVDILQIGRNDAAGCFYYVMELADDANAPVAADVRGLTSAGARVSPPAAVSDGRSASADSVRSLAGDDAAAEDSRAPDRGSPDPQRVRVKDGLGESARPRAGEAAAAGDSRAPKLEPPYVGCYSPKTLRSEIQRRTRLPFDDCIALGLSLARALAHLHAQGLVHRDIKPSNIIFVGGVPKLADIGLVTDVAEARSYVGTEGFIPPEGPGTPAADLFSLGKVLYEASTGKDRYDFPEPLTNLGDQPDKDRLLELNAILHKACHSDPRARYRNADEMVSDLELLLAGKSVKQRHSTARRWRFAKKAVLVAAVLITGMVWLRRSRPQPLDPLTTGRNIGGYPPTAMRCTTNKEAWDHYRLGYFAFRRLTDEGNQQAKQHFNQAIELDPKFALGYWGLWMLKFSDTRLLTHAESDEWRHLADKLVELDNGLAETHIVLGFIRFWEWKWSEAEAECREALRLNPDCIPAWVVLGFQLLQVGRTDEALQVLDHGLTIDPNTPQLVKTKGHAYFVRRQFQQALDLYLESVRREPLFPQAHRWTARSYFAMTNYPAAIDELQQYDLLRGERAPDEAKQEYAELRRAFREGGAHGFWLKQLDLIRAKWRPDEYPYTFAQIYAWLGDKEEALTFLEKAFERHDELVYLIFDECWDPWRDEPRFEAVRMKTGLPRHPNFPAR